MISKIGYKPTIHTKPHQTSHQISFTSRYENMSSDIYVNNKNIDSHISTMSGDIDITNSILKQGASTMSGDIDVSNCKVKNGLDAISGDISVYESNINGDVKAVSGDIRISDNSSVYGNISTTTGNVRIEKSNVKGDISTTTGKIMLKDSVIAGKITTESENLLLKGKNTIKDLILNAQNKSGLTIHTGNCILHIGSVGQIITENGAVINYSFKEAAKNSEPAKPIKFTLPAGNKITNNVEFISKVPGVLYLEKGAKLLGKVINGTVKYLK